MKYRQHVVIAVVWATNDMQSENSASAVKKFLVISSSNIYILGKKVKKKTAAINLQRTFFLSLRLR